MKPLIIHKLRQRSGASLLIALVFMLFCVFIGGSVLASATANSARLQRKAEDDQEYLTLRSAAALIVDELRPITRNGTQLTIVQDNSEVFGANPGADPTVKKTVAYLLTDNRNELRELAYLCAACEYRSVHDLSSANDTQFAQFTRYNRDPGLITPVMTENASGHPQSDFELTLKLDGDEYPLTARMVCSGDYDISVYFLTEGEINDKLHIEMKTSYLDTNDDEMVNVIWEAPMIVKGGA